MNWPAGQEEEALQILDEEARLDAQSAVQ